MECSLANCNLLILVYQRRHHHQMARIARLELLFAIIPFPIPLELVICLLDISKLFVRGMMIEPGIYLSHCY